MRSRSSFKKAGILLRSLGKAREILKALMIEAHKGAPDEAFLEEEERSVQAPAGTLGPRTSCPQVAGWDTQSVGGKYFMFIKKILLNVTIF